MRRTCLVSLSVLCLLLVALAPAGAETFDKKVKFQMGDWIDIDLEDGPATLHRMRIIRDDGGFTKSKFFRPGNDEYLETVQIQIEYSNSSSRDWEADIEIEWVDSKGRAIDGYNDTEEMDDRERHDLMTVTLSTLSYGLAQAQKMNVRLEIYPD